MFVQADPLQRHERQGELRDARNGDADRGGDPRAWEKKAHCQKEIIMMFSKIGAEAAAVKCSSAFNVPDCRVTQRDEQQIGKGDPCERHGERESPRTSTKSRCQKIDELRHENKRRDQQYDL